MGLFKKIISLYFIVMVVISITSCTVEFKDGKIKEVQVDIDPLDTTALWCQNIQNINTDLCVARLKRDKMIINENFSIIIY